MTYAYLNHRMSRRTFLAGVTLAGVNLAVFGLSGCAPKTPAAATGTDTLAFTPGTYTGTGEGIFGPLTLQATVTDSAITVGGGYSVRVGGTVYLKGEGYMGSGQIVALEQEVQG